jgi:dihydroneopterin triphosphate diphosphatase
MRQPIQVLIYVYRMTALGPSYLLLHRIPAEGNFWQGVSGGVEDLETPAETARREALEETGLTDLVVVDIHLCVSFKPNYPEHCRNTFGYVPDLMPQHVFVAEHSSLQPVRVDPTEHNSICWCSLEEAMDLLHWPTDKEALRYAHEFISKAASPPVSSAPPRDSSPQSTS